MGKEYFGANNAGYHSAIAHCAAPTPRRRGAPHALLALLATHRAPLLRARCPRPSHALAPTVARAGPDRRTRWPRPSHALAPTVARAGPDRRPTRAHAGCRRRVRGAARRAGRRARLSGIHTPPLASAAVAATAGHRWRGWRRRCGHALLRGHVPRHRLQDGLQTRAVLECVKHIQHPHSLGVAQCRRNKGWKRCRIVLARRFIAPIRRCEKRLEGVPLVAKRLTGPGPGAGLLFCLYGHSLVQQGKAMRAKLFFLSLWTLACTAGQSHACKAHTLTRRGE
jgi:hypothetical protein